MSATAVQTITTTSRRIMERIKAILEADANLNGLGSTTVPLGPVTVQIGFRKTPGTFPIIMVGQPQGARRQLSATGPRSDALYLLEFRIYTRHADMDRAEFEGELLADYVKMPLWNRPGLQTEVSGADAIANMSYFASDEPEQGNDVVSRDNAELDAFETSFKFYVRCAHIRRS